MSIKSFPDYKHLLQENYVEYKHIFYHYFSGVPGGGVFNPPLPEIPKALQNRAKLNPIVKTVKHCWI